MRDIRIPFARLTIDDDADAGAVQSAIARVVRSGWFVLGPEVEAFEREFAAASGAAHAVGVGNGTDAIALILRALAIGPGDEVITTSLSAAFTGLAITQVGARPVFVDIDPERLTLDASAVAAAVTSRTRALLPVHLYGQSADMAALEAVATRHGLAIVEDCCQAHLASSNGRPVGTVGAAGAFSFYPTKNLGALGDGGMVITDDPDLAAAIRRLRNGGQTDRYHHALAGVNSRLDELQAAILRARLPRLAGWTEARRAHGATYRSGLAHARVRVPAEFDRGHVYHLFPVLSERRDTLQAHLLALGIQTLVHYPVPLPAQQAFAPYEPNHCPVAERVCGELLSLPLYPGLSREAVAEVVEAVTGFGD